MPRIYLWIDGQQQGPFTADELWAQVAQGSLSASALACRDGGPAWVPVMDLLRQVEGLPKAEPPPGRTELAVSEVGPGLVDVRGVSKSFGHKAALKGVSFAVPQGQICGLLGPNGAGKTTLFRLLMGILKATEGSLTVDGLDAFEERVAVKRLIGFLPDEPVFYSYMSGRETLELSAAMHGLDPEGTLKRLGPLISQLRLGADLYNYAEDYSRGMKKKLGLLLALLHEPKLLILDEPTNGLDVESTQIFYEVVRGEAARGTTILFSTHLMDHVARLCSHAVIITGGQLLAKGSLDELRARAGEQDLEELFLKLTGEAAARSDDPRLKLPVLKWKQDPEKPRPPGGNGDGDGRVNY